MSLTDARDGQSHYPTPPAFLDLGPAACKNHPRPDIWFAGPKVGAKPMVRRPVDTPEQAEAKALCGTCVLRDECLAYAMAERQVGIWGGTTDEQRRMLRRARTMAGGK